MPKGKRIKYDDLRPPSLRGAVVVSDWNGVPRISAWPRKRGPNRHPTNIYWTNWLKAVTYLYRYQPMKVQAQYQAATEATPWMARDPFISGFRGRAFSFTDEEGNRYFPMVARQAVSQSLDALTQVVGKMLIRGATGWEATDPPAAGSVSEYWPNLTTGLIAGSYSWKGTRLRPGVATTVEAVGFAGTIVAGYQYQAMICTIDGGNQLDFIQKTLPWTVPGDWPASSNNRALFPFAEPLELTPGVTYYALAGITHLLDTTNFPVNSGSGTVNPRGIPIPGNPVSSLAYVAKKNPVLGDTMGFTTTAPVGIGVRAQIADVV